MVRYLPVPRIINCKNIIVDFLLQLEITIFLYLSSFSIQFIFFSQTSGSSSAKREKGKVRIEHFVIFEKTLFFFALTSKISRILTEYIKKICSLGSKQHLITICTIRILNILEVIAKNKVFQKSKSARPWFEIKVLG